MSKRRTNKNIPNKCQKCKRIFCGKNELWRHLNNPKDCITGKIDKNKLFYCKAKNCDKKYCRKDNLLKHQKTCKYFLLIKNKSNKINNNTIGRDLYNNSNNIKNSKINNIEKPTYINLIVFAKDGIDNLSAKDLTEILKLDSNIFEKIIKNVNFNPSKPQHHNIYYADTKNSYGEVYENNMWVKKKIDEILNILLDAKIEDFNKILNDMNFLSKKIRNQIKEAIEQVDYSKPNARKKLFGYLKLILNNHKHMIETTKNKSKPHNNKIKKVDEPYDESQ